MQTWHELYKIVHTLSTFNPGLLKENSPTASLQLLQQALTEVRSLRAGFLQKTLSCKSKKEIKILVTTHQAFLSDLLSIVYSLKSSHLQDKKKTSYDNNSVLSLQDNLLSFLSFLQVHFPGYFDVDQVMPEAYSESIMANFNNRIRIAFKILNQALPAQVCAMLSQPFSIFIKNAGTHTFKYYFQLRQYLTALENNCHRLNDGDRNLSLLETFITINYCPDGFLQYFFSQYSKQFSSNYTISQQKEEWQKLLALVNSSYINDPTVENLPLLKNTVLATIEYYMALLPATQPEMGKVQFKEHLDLKTPLSVAQIGLFVRLLVDTGMIQCKNQSLLIRMLASVVKASRSSDISPESLRIKFYDIDQSTVKIMKDYVIGLMNQLRSY